MAVHQPPGPSDAVRHPRLHRPGKPGGKIFLQGCRQNPERNSGEQDQWTMAIDAIHQEYQEAVYRPEHRD